MQPGSSSSPFHYRDSNGELAGLGEAHIHSVAPGYFDTVGIPLLAGRDVRSTDGTNAPRAVPINQNLARVIPPDGGSPVGLPLFQNDQGRAPFKIIGVVADAKYDNIRTDAPITVYMPFAQTAIRGATFFVKTDGDPLRIASIIRQAMEEDKSMVPAKLREKLMEAGPLKAALTFRVESGSVTFKVNTVSSTGVQIPDTILSGIIQRVAQIQPEKFDTTKPIPLPFGLRTLSTREKMLVGGTGLPQRRIAGSTSRQAPSSVR